MHVIPKHVEHEAIESVEDLSICVVNKRSFPLLPLSKIRWRWSVQIKHTSTYTVQRVQLYKREQHKSSTGKSRYITGDARLRNLETECRSKQSCVSASASRSCSTAATGGIGIRGGALGRTGPAIGCVEQLHSGAFDGMTRLGLEARSADASAVAVKSPWVDLAFSSLNNE